MKLSLLRGIEVGYLDRTRRQMAAHDGGGRWRISRSALIAAFSAGAFGISSRRNLKATSVSPAWASDTAPTRCCRSVEIGSVKGREGQSSRET